MIKEKKEYDISVIMVSYNPNFTKLFKTIKSVIYQKNVNIQLIVCDDGSTDNYFYEIKEYLCKQNFPDYQLISSNTNNGTVINFYRGLIVSSGKYIKVISPGDYLYDENTLYKWLKFMNDNHIDLSFGHAIFYHYVNQYPVLFKRQRDSPAIAKIYDIKRKSAFYKEIRKIDWLVCRDSILGCLIFCKSELCKKYISEIIYKIKYAEDYMFRFMLLDNIEMIHYDAPVLYYEYGNGVSSPKKWKKFLYNDEAAFREILKLRENKNRFIKQYIMLLKFSKLDFFSFRRQLFSVLVFPLSFPWKIYKLIYRKMDKSKPYIDEYLASKIKKL